MTTEKTVEKIVENNWFKGIARISIVFSSVILAPAIVFIGERVITLLEHHEVDIQLLKQQAINDRVTALKLSEDAQHRLDLAFQRINLMPTKVEVDKDFQLRDQRIDGIDRRVVTVEEQLRAAGRSPPRPGQ